MALSIKKQGINFEIDQGCTFSKTFTAKNANNAKRAFPRDAMTMKCMTNETKIVLDPTISPPIWPLIRRERVHKQELHTFARFLKGHDAKQ